MRIDRLSGRLGVLAVLVAPLAPPAALGQDAALEGYFGFDRLEIIKIGESAGPIAAADMDGDGREDLIVVNNHASRIEIHYQRVGASPDDALSAPVRVNDLPEHWRFRRESISVTHAVSAIVPFDFDSDGAMDLIYAGIPEEIVFVRQTSPGVFAVSRRHRVRDLAAGRDGLAVADISGDSASELLALVRGAVHVWPLSGDALGTARTLAAGAPVVAMAIEDYDGDGRLDIAGVVPDDSAPLRIWFGTTEAASGVIGAQRRFEMPPLMEVMPVRLPGAKAARLAVIERPSKRIVIGEIAVEELAASGDRDVAISARSFTDPDNRKRQHSIVDADGDGRLDLVVSDTEANTVVVYRQREGRGLGTGVPHPSLSEMTALVAGNVDDDPAAEIFVLSEKEAVVGRCDVTPDGDVPFPTPLPISAAHSPTAINLTMLDGGWRLAVVTKDSRDYRLELLDFAGGSTTVELGKLSRSPDAIVALDADQDGATDLLLLTREKPMTMLRATPEGFVLTESKDMGQFGLVQAAEAENTAVFDIDGDARPELLIAQGNFVRAVRYEPTPASGVSPGWQVVDQINAHDSRSKLVSLSFMGDRLIAADRENGRLVVFGREGADGPRREIESLDVRGFPFSAIHAGSFAGDGSADILAIGDDAFAILRLSGPRLVLREIDAWRTTEERRVQHELAAGDVNGDGFIDLVSLDAGEQMCEIFTFTETGHLLYAMGFQVFESRLFGAGTQRQYEPSQALIADLTGDGAKDLVLLAHDRLLLYPQMTP